MHSSIVDEIVALGSELNANQYKLVRLAAEYDAGVEWFHDGFASSALAIATRLDIHTSTAREWIRVGQALDAFPLIDQAFRSNRLSYAKTRILTRWADPETERELLDLAHSRTANRLTAAIANYLAGEEGESERDQRHHDNRSVTVYTDAEGMVIIRAALPPAIGKQIAASLNEIMHQVAATPLDPAVDTLQTSDASEDGSPPHGVIKSTTKSGAQSSAETHSQRCVSKSNTEGGWNVSADARAPEWASESTMGERLRELKRRWQPLDDDGFHMPSVAQQRADAFILLFLDRNIDLTTEVVIHVRGDGTTFDDGTPITNNAVCQRLDLSFIRAMVHDSERRPINASGRRRHPTTRQKRVVLEAHNHECVDCQGTELLELDHNPPYHQTRHTVTAELEPRCAPCHRARHWRDRAVMAVPAGARGY